MKHTYLEPKLVILRLTESYVLLSASEEEGANDGYMDDMLE